MRYLVTKRETKSTPQTCSMDSTYRDVPAPVGGTPSVAARWSPLGRRIHVTLKGPSQLGESCGTLLGLVLIVRLGPDPGFPSAFDTGALSLVVAIPACTCRKPRPVGNLEGFPEEGKIQLRRLGSMGSLWGPSSCLHRSRSLRRRHPSGPPQVTDTRGPVQPRPPHRRPPFLYQVGDEVESRLWKTTRAAR
jgi:hypothetical protein